MAGRRRLMFAKHFTVDYLKFTALESGTITLTIGSNVTVSNLEYVEYSTDGETWTKTNNVASTEVTITTPTVSSGNYVLWRGIGVRTAANTSSYTTSSYYSHFSSTGQCNVSGNINTLLGGESPSSVVVSEHMYKYLFTGMSTLISAENLKLPSLTANYCFDRMFTNCTSLTVVPALPAVTLSSYCYRSMFSGCSSIVTAPELPAKSLTSYCYYEMFKNCSSLSYIKADYESCTNAYYNYNWTSGVSSIGTFIKARPLVSSYVYQQFIYSAENVPYGWTIQSSFVVKTINSSGVMTTTPSIWIPFKTYAGKTLHLTLGDTEFTGTVSSSAPYTFQTTNGNKSVNLKMSVSYDRSGMPQSVSATYTVTNMGFSVNDVIEYSCYAE